MLILLLICNFDLVSQDFWKLMKENRFHKAIGFLFKSSDHISLGWSSHLRPLLKEWLKNYTDILLQALSLKNPCETLSNLQQNIVNLET